MKKCYLAIAFAICLFSSKSYSHDTLRVNVGVSMAVLTNFNATAFENAPQARTNYQLGAVYNFFHRKHVVLGIGYNFSYFDFDSNEVPYEQGLYFTNTKYRTFRNDLYLLADIKLSKNFLLSPFLGSQIVSNKFLQGHIVVATSPTESNLEPANNYKFNSVINATYGFEFSMINLNIPIDRMGVRVHLKNEENFGIGQNNTIKYITTAFYISKYL